MSLFSACLRAALRERHITQKALAAELGVSTVYINRLCSGAQLPRMDLFLKMCDALALTPSAFFACDGAAGAQRIELTEAELELVAHYRLLPPEQQGAAAEMIAALARRPRARIARPRAARYAHRAVSGYAAAGLPLFDPAADGEIELPAKYADSARYMLCVARGTSMQPDILDGDVAVVERGTQAESGMVALVHIESATSSDGEYAIKRFYPFSDHAELRSINPEHPTMVYPASAILSAERVVHVIHRAEPRRDVSTP